jgi:hypothetical protein
MAEVRLFVTEFGETINNIKRLEEELKRLKSIYKEAASGSQEFINAQKSAKEVTAILKEQNDALKANTNALGGINSAVKFAEGTYGRLKQQLKENRDMLDKVTINGKVYNALIAEQTKLRQQQIQVEMSMPSLFQERVKGAIDQSKAIQGLNMSMSQLTREMPAFANSVQTGFMAISNNLPIFFDAIQKIKNENIELAKQGKATTSVFKSIVSSLFSVQSLLSIGVTLLTVYGAKIIESISALTSQQKALESLTEANDNYNQSINQTKEDIQDLTIQLKVQSGILTKNEGDIQKNENARNKALNENKKLREKSIEDLKKELELTDEIIANFGKTKRIVTQGGEVRDINLLSASESNRVRRYTAGIQEINKLQTESNTLINQEYDIRGKILKVEEENSKKTKEKKVKQAKISTEDDQIKILEAAILRRKNLNEDSMIEEIALENYKYKKILSDNTKSYGDRLKATEEYFKNVSNIQRESIEKNRQEEITLLEAQIQERINLNEKGFDEQRKLIEYNYQIQQEDAKGNYEALYKAEVEFNAKIIELEKAQKEEEERINREYFKKDIDLRRSQQNTIIEELRLVDEVNFQDQMDNLNAQYEAKKEILNTQREEELYGVDQNSAKYLEIQARYANMEIELRRSTEAEKQKLRLQEIDTVKNTMQVIMDLNTMLAEDDEQKYNQRLDRLNRQRENELAGVEKDSAKYVEIKKRYANEEVKIESEKEAQKQRLQVFAKMSALINIAANTAIAISNLVATSFSPLSPDNIATGGIAAFAKLAVGLVAITSNMVQAKQMLSSFEEGGYTGQGNPHEVSTNLGSKSYTYHKDEYVIPSRVLNTQKGSMLASQLEGMRLGMSNPMPHISGMFDGGFTGRSAGMETTNMLQNQAMLQKFMESMPNPVVRVTDINRTQGNVQRAVQVSSL